MLLAWASVWGCLPEHRQLTEAIAPKRVTPSPATKNTHVQFLVYSWVWSHQFFPLHLVFWSLSQDLTDWLDRLASRPQGASHLYFPRAGMTGTCHCTQHSCGCWGSELRSSYLGSRHFPHRATSPASEPFLILELCAMVSLTAVWPLNLRNCRLYTSFLATCLTVNLCIHFYYWGGYIHVNIYLIHFPLVDIVSIFSQL